MIKMNTHIGLKENEEVGQVAEESLTDKNSTHINLS